MTNETCRERLAVLEEQNGYLREAATRFGELAERLNEELKKARWTARRAHDTRR